MTLFLHRGRSTDALADGLAELLSVPLADPFADEVVAVPTKGVERWLAQRLSHRLGAAPGGSDGVCAGVRFLNPHSLVALVLGIERGDPWHPEQLAWPVLTAIDDSLDEPWAKTLADHLGHGMDTIDGELRRGRRYAVARRLAGLFSEYAAQRPAMIAEWRAGGDGDGLGGSVDADLAWQPHLWRRVLALVGGEAPDERLARVVAALTAGDLDGLDLPGRLSLFGHTRIARAEIEVISALAEHRDVHLWLPQASPVAWDRIAAETDTGPVPRTEDGSGLHVAHPLLASLGRDSREVQRTLALAGGQEDGAADAPRGPSTAADARPVSLLRLLQDDIAADHPPTEEERKARHIPATDRSIQVHACHGLGRQVEVLRDVITDLLEHDHDLEPRDILVMCPDVETFAPLIHAAFGMAGIVADDTAATHPAHTFRVRIADRAPTHTNPLLLLADHLVLLAGGRLTASEVLDLARRPVVRHRFGLDDGALERLSDWTTAVAVRWGLDADHRELYRLRGLTQNTWRAGLERILVGAAVDGQQIDHLGTTLALDDLDSGDIDLAGRFAELIERLAVTLEAIRAAVSAQDWVEALRDGVHGLADVPAKDAWQVAQFEHELARMGAAAGGVGGADGAGGPALGIADVHALLAGRGAGRATRASFRTGALTVCTMMPMRSVPHKVVALVGLDDGVFPRTAVPDGDDALARRPVTGERDVRSEDRQLLLDALMSAGQTVVVTYAGFDEHSGQRRPPAVPLGELIDAVQRTASGPGVDRLITEHPLQAFDARNLGAAGEDLLLPEGRPFSYDPAAVDAAKEALGERQPPLTVAEVTLPDMTEDPVELTDLVRFFDDPARAYLRTRLGMVLPEVPEQPTEGIPIELDGLATWSIGDRVLRSVLAGQDLDAICAAERWRGELPPGELGEQRLREIVTEVQDLTRIIWQVAGAGRPGVPLPSETIDIDVTLPSGRHLSGTVAGLVGDQIVTATYSSIRPKQRLRSWITSLALAAAGTPYPSQLIGRERAWNRVRQVRYVHGGHDRDRALELLDQLLEVRDLGLRSPIPLPLQTSYVWAESYLREGHDDAAARNKARGAWESDPGAAFAKEQHEPSHQFVHGGVVPLRAILGTPLPGEIWDKTVPSRLGQFALRVWRPLLEDDKEEKFVR